MDAMQRNTRILQTPRHVRRTGRDGTTPGVCDVDINTPWCNSPVLIVGTIVSPACGIGRSLGVLNKQQSKPPSVSRNIRNFNASVDGNLDNDGYSTSIFIKAIGFKLPNSLSDHIYLRFRMNFTSNAVGTKAPNFVNLGILSVNPSDEFNTFVTPTTIIRRTTDGPHWSVIDHILEKLQRLE